MKNPTPDKVDHGHPTGKQIPPSDDTGERCLLSANETRERET
jgi:hypothetical protein